MRADRSNDSSALIFGAQLDSLYSMYHYHLDRVTSETYAGKLVNYHFFYYNPSSASLDYGLDWLKKRAKPEDVVAASMPHWVYLRTGLKAVRPPLESNRDRAQALLDSVPVAYIVLNFEGEMQFVNDYILPLVQDDSQAWRFVFTDEKGLVRIYERVRSEDRDKGEQ
jgi:PAS domain-containing protein